jgi:glycerol-3-phosphate acyltransferase PlsY
MNPSLATLAIVVAAYLIGSISFAVVVSKLFGLPDPHGYGSGNPGATNVLRTGNRAAAALTLVGDGVKGFVAVWLANRLGAGWAEASTATAGAAVAVFLGHVYPVFHRFAGGKGVATAGGVILGLSWQLGLAVFALWIGVALAFRISSLAALIAAAAAPVLSLYVLGNRPQAWALFPISALLIWRHRANIRKLLAGEERKIGH